MLDAVKNNKELLLLLLLLLLAAASPHPNPLDYRNLGLAHLELLSKPVFLWDVLLRRHASRPSLSV